MESHKQYMSIYLAQVTQHNPYTFMALSCFYENISWKASTTKPEENHIATLNT